MHCCIISFWCGVGIRYCLSAESWNGWWCSSGFKGCKDWDVSQQNETGMLQCLRVQALERVFVNPLCACWKPLVTRVWHWKAAADENHLWLSVLGRRKKIDHPYLCHSHPCCLDKCSLLGFHACCRLGQLRSGSHWSNVHSKLEEKWCVRFPLTLSFNFASSLKSKIV